MRAAIYARVSTGRQERDQTIDGQLTALRQWTTEQGHELRSEYVFTELDHLASWKSAMTEFGRRQVQSVVPIKHVPDNPRLN